MICPGKRGAIKEKEPKALTKLGLDTASLMTELPELGTLSPGKIAKLVGVAPLNCDSGTMQGQRHIWGGRARFTPEEMAAYLDAWLSDAPDDLPGIARALGDIARAKGMAEVARLTGLSRENLYRALSAEGNPSFATILKVTRALGVQLHATVA